MTGRILLLAFGLLLLGRIFYRPQLTAFKRWFDGVINALLLAIAITYLVRAALWLFS